MSATTVFYQECPVCGRNLRIAVKYFGRPMSCAHCEGEFIAGQEREPLRDDGVNAMGPAGGLLPSPLFGQPQLGEV